ncbi:hypothetical protein GWI33_008834 [Rhynchophorus ferrugineus]|uniref:Uncharacterized protein n=1 Tax=Rhynchophorus ferrugineus TaxID=354439 RepID=A0A834IHH0_RHYFE|nr:hypothetical protein GWI33_008834 [Rhynchophorus ferrugineus]
MASRQSATVCLHTPVQFFSEYIDVNVFFLNFLGCNSSVRRQNRSDRPCRPTTGVTKTVSLPISPKRTGRGHMTREDGSTQSHSGLTGPPPATRTLTPPNFRKPSARVGEIASGTTMALLGPLSS